MLNSCGNREERRHEGLIGGRLGKHPSRGGVILYDGAPGEVSCFVELVDGLAGKMPVSVEEDDGMGVCSCGRDGVEGKVCDHCV